MLASQCLVLNCNNQRVERTLACQIHQPQWQKHAKNNNRQNQAGVRRMSQRPVLGNPNAKGQIHNDMMIQMKIHHHLKTTFVLLDSIVLRLFVHLVVLLLPGQGLQDQNPQQIF